jgi:hypothetical protein
VSTSIFLHYFGIIYASISVTILHNILTHVTPISVIYAEKSLRPQSSRFTWQQFRRRVEHAGDLAVRHEGPAEGDATDVGAQEEGDLLDFRVLETIENSGAFHSFLSKRKFLQSVGRFPSTFCFYKLKEFRIKIPFSVWFLHSLDSASFRFRVSPNSASV